MATYNGSNLFGPAAVVKVIDNPTAEQRASYFGVIGQTSLFGNLRGSIIEIRGILVDTNPANLNSQIQTIKSYRDGIARAFVDNYGNTYPNVLMGRYVPAGERVYRVAGGGYGEVFQIVLESLSP